MIKFAILLKRHHSLTQEEFVQYHIYNHAPLFKSIPEVQEYVQKYVQGQALPVTLPGMPPPVYDGTTKLWFDTVEGIADVFTAPRYMEIIRPDEEKFLDLPGFGFLVCTENPVI